MGHGADLRPAAAGARSAALCGPPGVDPKRRLDGAPRWHAVHQGGCGYAGRPCRRRSRCAGCPINRPAVTEPSNQFSPAARPPNGLSRAGGQAARRSRFPPPNPSPVPRAIPARGPRCPSPSRCLPRASMPPRMGRAWSRVRAGRPGHELRRLSGVRTAAGRAATVPARGAAAGCRAIGSISTCCFGGPRGWRRRRW